jgi:hypothetical protein
MRERKKKTCCVSERSLSNSSDEGRHSAAVNPFHNSLASTQLPSETKTKKTLRCIHQTWEKNGRTATI